jgi:hypothetical protein
VPQVKLNSSPVIRPALPIWQRAFHICAEIRNLHHLFTFPLYACRLTGEREMPEIEELDAMYAAYKAAVEAWITAIREEEALASGDHSIADIDKWEEAHFREEKARNKAKAAKKDYEGALREEFFHF